MTEGTKYYLLKRCLNCDKVNEFQLTKCSQCSYLFTGQATELEKEKHNEKIAKMQQLAEEKEE